MPSKQGFTFDKDEAVLAFHGPLIHEATVAESIAKDAPDKTRVKLHLLHYNGWDSHWDEWVPESRMLKDNPENRARQKERIKEFQRAYKRKKPPENKSDATAKVAKAGTSAKPGSGSDEAAALCAEIREQLRLPHGAKLKLIEDWEHISRERKLVPLPRTPPISTILEEFLAAKARRTSHERLYGEVCDGVRAYFNQALPSILLYKFEKKQHRELKEKSGGGSAEPVSIYGAEHLLRLFVKMPELLARCAIPREHVTVLISKLSELLKFLMNNKAKYFAAEYQCPDELYLNWWQSDENKSSDK